MKWRHNTWYPQPTIDEEKTGYLDLMAALVDQGADVNAPHRAASCGSASSATATTGSSRLARRPFWRAAQANDVAAMRLLVARGADPADPDAARRHPADGRRRRRLRIPGHEPRPRRAAARRCATWSRSCTSTSTHATSSTTPRSTAPPTSARTTWSTYLVSKGADPKARAKGRLGGTQGAVDVAEGTGDTVADMANGPREKSLLHPDTVKLLEQHGLDQLARLPLDGVREQHQGRHQGEAAGPLRRPGHAPRRAHCQR